MKVRSRVLSVLLVICILFGSLFAPSCSGVNNDRSVFIVSEDSFSSSETAYSNYSSDIQYIRTYFFKEELRRVEFNYELCGKEYVAKYDGSHRFFIGYEVDMYELYDSKGHKERTIRIDQDGNIVTIIRGIHAEEPLMELNLDPSASVEEIKQALIDVSGEEYGLEQYDDCAIHITPDIQEIPSTVSFVFYNTYKDVPILCGATAIRYHTGDYTVSRIDRDIYDKNWIESAWSDPNTWGDLDLQTAMSVAEEELNKQINNIISYKLYDDFITSKCIVRVNNKPYYRFLYRVYTQIPEQETGAKEDIRNLYIYVAIPVRDGNVSDNIMTYN